MNIYQRRDGRFEGRISRGKRSNGTRRFQYFFGKTKEDVREKMAKERCKKSDCPLTVTQLFNEWHKSIKHTVKESTAANYYLKANKHILPSFGNKLAESIEDIEIYAFIESKQQAGLSNRYISDMLIVMKSMFKYAVRTYHIYNPMECIEMPRAKMPEITLLDEKEQTKLQEYIAHNQNKATLGVALSMTKAKEYLISGSNKATEPRTLQYRFASILNNVKLPSIHFHALRHMFATNCVKLGFDIKSLSEILGHSSVEITLNRYVHSSIEQKRDYMKRLSMVF